MRKRSKNGCIVEVTLDSILTTAINEQTKPDTFREVHKKMQLQSSRACPLESLKMDPGSKEMNHVLHPLAAWHNRTGADNPLDA